MAIRDEPTCPDVDGTYRIHHAPFKIGGLYHIDPASREANNRTVIALYDDAGLFRGEVKVAAGTDLWWKLVKDAQYRAGAVFCPYNKGMDMGDGVYEGEGQFLESIPGGLASRGRQHRRQLHRAPLQRAPYRQRHQGRQLQQGRQQGL
ncbi:hypothetical protein GGR50DRAFT_693664 [Xylaria sp. CBS 124048]|nr:hypothetical protein GGR50DRAFT_693664 [Xylaria sp. CBS 124048]